MGEVKKEVHVFQVLLRWLLLWLMMLLPVVSINIFLDFFSFDHHLWFFVCMAL